MIDRIRIIFTPDQTEDFFPALQVRLNNPQVATLRSQRPTTSLEGAIRSNHTLGWPRSIDVATESQGLVEIEGSASRLSGFDSPVREIHFPHTDQSTAAQASLLMDNALLCLA